MKREMRKQIDSVNAELNQQIETVQTELKLLRERIGGLAAAGVVVCSRHGSRRNSIGSSV